MASERHKRRRNRSPSPERSSGTSINGLPESILLRIISLLPLDDSIRSSRVARLWRYLWRSVPSLSFDMVSFHSKIPRQSSRSARRRFAEFISNALRRRDPDEALQKLRLFFCYGYNRHTRHRIGSWFRSAIRAKVIELDLFFSQWDSHSAGFLIPNKKGEEEHQVFRLSSNRFFDIHNSSVQVLKLHGIRFEIPDEALSLKLGSVRELHLERFVFHGDELANLIASCVNLQILSLAQPEHLGSEILKIASQHLKHLKLHNFQNMGKFSVEIRAPSLVSLNVSCFYAKKFTLEKSPTLIEALVVFDSSRSSLDFIYWTNLVSCLSGVECLTTQNMWMYDLQSPWYPFQPGEENYGKNCGFHNLKHLELLTALCSHDVRGLENMFEQCPQLETMDLVYKCGHHHEKMEFKDVANVVFRIPHLRLVKMKDFKATKNERYLVALLKKHGLVLEQIVAYPIAVTGKSVPYHL